MAITYEAAGQHEFPNTVSALSFTPDSGTRAGDVFVVAEAHRGSASATFPDGTVDNHLVNYAMSGGGDRRVSVFTWKAPEDAPDPVEIPLSAATTGSVTWVRVRGASGVIDSDQEAEHTGQATSVTVPALSLSVPGCFLVYGIFAGSSSNTVTASSPLVERAGPTGVVRNLIATAGVYESTGLTPSRVLTNNPETARVAWGLGLAPVGEDGPEPVGVEEAVATAQTEYMPTGLSGDIADTPAIWVNKASPVQSVILGSRKHDTNGGIDVYDLTGARLSFYASGETNAVALRDLEGVDGWDDRILVIGTNRLNGTLDCAWLDRDTRTLSSAGSISLGFTPYGCCLYVSQVDGEVYAFVSETTGGGGQLDQYKLTRSGSNVSGTKVRDLSTPTLSEGMACDDEHGWLFVGEEDVGLFRYNAEPDGGTSRVTIDEVGAGRLFADVEGIAITYDRDPDGDHYIIVSSQGNSTFAVYELADPHNFVKSFRVVGAGSGIDDVADTDGIAVTREYLGPAWPHGLFVAHDSINTGSTASNFKLVDASQIFDAYPLPEGTITTTELTNPSGRWQGKATRVSWWDGSRWGAVLPTDLGHTIFPDLDDLGTVGPIVDGRQNTRVSVVTWGSTLGVLRGHGSTSRFSSYDMSAGYAPIVENATVPLASSNLDASPVVLHRSPNGYLWAACMVGGEVRVTRSTNDGASWGTARTVATISDESGAVGLTTTGTTVVLVATANEGAGRAVRTIGQDSPAYTSVSWSTESLPGLPSGVTSDDHLDVATLPDGRVLAVSKTTDASTSGHPLIYALVRSTGGSWSAETIEPGPDDDPRYTRPSLAIEPGAVRLLYGMIAGDSGTPPLFTRVGEPGAWSSRSVLDDTGDRSDSAVAPAAEHIAAAAPGDYPVLMHDRDTGAIDVLWVSPVVPPVEAVSNLALGELAVSSLRLGDAGVVGVMLGSTPIWVEE